MQHVAAICSPYCHACYDFTIDAALEVVLFPLCGQCPPMVWVGWYALLRCKPCLQNSPRSQSCRSPLRHHVPNVPQLLLSCLRCEIALHVEELREQCQQLLAVLHRDDDPILRKRLFARIAPTRGKAQKLKPATVVAGRGRQEWRTRDLT